MVGLYSEAERPKRRETGQLKTSAGDLTGRIAVNREYRLLPYNCVCAVHTSWR